MTQVFDCYADTDSVKRTIMKTALNSVYGKVVTEMKNTRDYIVIHSTDGNIGIIFTDKIGAILMYAEDKATIHVDGIWIDTIDKYTDVIAKLFK